jgi:hypothetical protein
MMGQDGNRARERQTSTLTMVTAYGGQMADYSGQSENCLIINFIYSHRNMKYLIV